MDPDKAWELLVKAAETWYAFENGGHGDLAAYNLAASDMADLVLALNNWAKMGGFPPKPFRNPASTL